MTKQADTVYAREISLYAVNTESLYRQRALPIIANLRRKIARGTYDATLALKAWQYLADDAAKLYAKEFRCTVADKPTRTAAAAEIAEHYADALTGEA